MIANGITQDEPAQVIKISSCTVGMCKKGD